MKSESPHQSDPYQTRMTLIRRVQNPLDETSWEDFIQIYQGYAYAIIRNMNINPSDAEDLVQQLMVKLWTKIPEMDIEQIRSFRGWIARTTRNMVIDFIRKKTRETHGLDGAKQDSTKSYLNAIRLPEIEQIAEREWKLHLTNLAMQNIQSLFSGAAIEVFKLSLKGFDNETIAQQLGLKPNSVYRLRNRVKKRLIVEIKYLRNELEPPPQTRLDQE